MDIIWIRGSAKVKYIRIFLYFICPKVNLWKSNIFFLRNVISITLSFFRNSCQTKKKPPRNCLKKIKKTKQKRKVTKRKKSLNYFIFTHEHTTSNVNSYDKLCSMKNVFKQLYLITKRNLLFQFFVIFSILIKLMFWIVSDPANIYLFKVNNRNIRERCEICSKSTIKTP